MTATKRQQFMEFRKLHRRLCSGDCTAGYIVAGTGTGTEIATPTGLSEGWVGTLFTAVSTSLPELMTSVFTRVRGLYWGSKVGSQ